MSWENAWREQRTPWDIGGSPPVLHELIAAGQLPQGRAFVPGAGSGYDVLTLAAAGWTATGLDVAETAAARFVKLRSSAEIGTADARLVVADFFDWQTDQRFDLIWDYTFLCALPSERRADWARRVDELLADEGRLVTLIFPLQPIHDDPHRPPYVLSFELVRALLAPHFVAEDSWPVARSHCSRRGNEYYACWKRRID